ncbi:GGDEF domain-containing protein [Couchioplanes caeruleus]|uniref:GGDEF domain-containing protein n=2 Tax=Couchioplanes caeruleus TaxID=56438 RepID=A0A1K0FEA1_9ACTN|nr:GGDEF domain-containing protein [Couchioplanes caeruleus]OJF11064.1 hypothetical protein BG844_28355 [Couchioplanes caeruleus subsp. caeruleus]ROP33683.1 diguanylate cyclase (GGDEF)-like protein [Couchioplanes caeruleus]
MLVPVPVVAPSAGVRSLRASALCGLLVPAVSGVYLAGTTGGPHRAAMVATVAAMAVTGLLTYVGAGAVERSDRRVPVELVGAAATIVGAAFLGVLDGGVASPLGALLPFCLVFFAVATPPRKFAPIAAGTALAYWFVALTGGEAPPGYAWVRSLGYGLIAYLCLRHHAALTSLRRRLAQVSRVDSLTGCLNRRGFDERLATELARAEATGSPVTLVLADLDRFKDVNDTYGHQAGDDLLAWAGRTLTDGVRTHDAVGRIGGDEFAALLTDTGTGDAQAVVKRLRATLGPVAPASIGCASYPDEAATAAELKILADQRVYQDKTARVRQVPSSGAVAAARAALERGVEAKVSRRERRRHSTADMGRLGIAVGWSGLAQALVFSTANPRQAAMAVILALAGVLGALVMLTADRLSRSTRLRHWMNAYGFTMYAMATTVVALDGGASSAMAAGLLAGMPLVALSTPRRIAVPLLAAASLSYLGLATFVGASSAWHVAMQLGGTLAVATVCGRQGAVAGQQRRLLTALSRVDVLTDTLNRRGFEERFTAACALAATTGAPIALLIFDLNGFKQVNDQHGHAAGDELLRWVAHTLQTNVGPGDVVGRLGGDEFVVLLTRPNHDSPGAHTDRRAPRAVADSLRTALAHRTAASVGTAVFGQHGTDFDTLYAHADHELYAQKTQRLPAGAPPTTHAPTY